MSWLLAGSRRGWVFFRANAKRVALWLIDLRMSCLVRPNDASEKLTSLHPPVRLVNGLLCWVVPSVPPWDWMGPIGSSHWRHLPRAAAICKGLEPALPLDRVVRGLCLTLIFVTFQSCYPDICISSEKRTKFHVDWSMLPRNFEFMYDIECRESCVIKHKDFIWWP